MEINLDDSISSILDDDLHALRESVREFANKVLYSQAKNLETLGSIPRSLWLQLGTLGGLGVTAQVDFGGLGLSTLAHVIVMEELSTVSPSLGLSYGAHSNLCLNQIVLNGTPEQHRTFLPKLISGEHIGALAMSESGAGSDVTSMTLLASPSSGKDGFFLTGSKMWVTNGPVADIIVVYAKTDPALGSKGITAFIVERSKGGFSSAPKLDKLGMRASETCELFFDKCFVPHENILGRVNEGVKVLMSGLDYERIVLAGGPLGIMRASLELSLNYARERRQFGQAIGEFQLIQGKLADMYTAYQASRAYVYGVAKNKRISRKDAASVILYAAENATQLALHCIQILGGNGYTNDYLAGQLLRDAKLYEIGAGTSEIRRMLLGRELFHGR
jgi:isovaleryl-CoA dehydrogenase